MIFSMIGQFRVCLEKLNCQFEDFQCLALFAYFDDDNDGYVTVSILMLISNCC